MKLPSRKLVLREDDWRDIVQLLGRAKVIESTGESLVDQARRMFDSRGKRDAIFGPGLFGEPAWDILLLLFIEKGGRRHSIGQIAKLAGLPLTTAIRWIDALERRNFVYRSPHPTDLRAIFVEMTEEGEMAMETYLSETLSPTK